VEESEVTSSTAGLLHQQESDASANYSREDNSDPAKDFRYQLAGVICQHTNTSTCLILREDIGTINAPTSSASQPNLPNDEQKWIKFKETEVEQFNFAEKFEAECFGGKESKSSRSTRP
jgi:hypothetical protein